MTFGFRWTDASPTLTPNALQRFLPAIVQTGAQWLVLPLSLAHPPQAARAIATTICAAGLTPLVQWQVIGTEPTPEMLHAALQAWVAGGVRHVIVDDQPNRAERWTRWLPHGLPQRYARWLAPLLEVVASFDEVVPILPPFAPYGAYRGLTFLQETLAELQRLQPAWLDRLAVACVNDSNGKSLLWGRGGMATWGTTSRADHEDESGFYGWEWVQQQASATLGREVAVYATRTDVSATADQATIVQMARGINRTTAPLVATFPLKALEGFAKLGQMRSAAASLQAKTQQAVPTMVRVLHEGGRVESMALDEYLRGVVPAEIGAGSPMEALKAQAVAARCYAARAARSPRHTNADICTTTHCQVWRVQSYPRTDEAIAATVGVIAYHEGRIIDALYFACCDGNTKNSEAVWRNRVPYLRGVSCTLKHQAQYGHGVGMCQRGAIQMARQGASYRDILHHYYTGVSIEQGAIEEAPPAPSPIPTPPAETSPAPPAPPPPSPIQIERRAGVRAVAGSIRQGGIPVLVADPWGNQYRTTSGTKPELGVNGWEVVVPIDAVYRVTWADKQINVAVRGDFVLVKEA